MNPSTNRTDNEIALVGMAGRFPGANTLEAFWHNLQAGRESISLIARVAEVIEERVIERLEELPENEN